MRAGSTLEAFEALIRRDADGCWIWLGAIKDTGYGAIRDQERRGRDRRRRYIVRKAAQILAEAVPA